MLKHWWKFGILTLEIRKNMWWTSHYNTIKYLQSQFLRSYRVVFQNETLFAGQKLQKCLFRWKRQLGVCTVLSSQPVIALLECKIWIWWICEFVKTNVVNCSIVLFWSFHWGLALSLDSKIYVVCILGGFKKAIRYSRAVLILWI